MEISIYYRTGNEAYDLEQWEVPFTSFSLEEELNQGFSGNLSFKYNDFKNYLQDFGSSYTIQDVLTSRMKYILIKDTHDNNTKVFRGFLKYFRFTQDTSGDATVTLYFVDLSYFLTKRLSSTHFADTDAGMIAWSMIAETQNKQYGDLGILAGTIEATKNRQRTLDHDCIRDVIIGMSAAKLDDGYDWWIDKDNYFHVAAQRGDVLENLIFDEANSFSWTMDQRLAGELTNSCYVRGRGDEEAEQAPEIDVSDLSEADKWGLHEKFLSADSVVETSTLTDHGKEVLSSESVPSQTISLSFSHVSADKKDGGIPLTDYDLGDFVKVKSSFLQIDAVWRVRKRSIKMENSRLVVLVTVNQLSPDDKYFKSQTEISKTIQNLEKAVAVVQNNGPDINEIIDTIYPIDSIYLSVNSANPNTLFGGTWVQLKDRFLLGAGDVYTNDNTGGSDQVTLNITQVPPHRHWISSASRDDGNGTGCGSNGQDYGVWSDAGGYTDYDQLKVAGRYDSYTGGTGSTVNGRVSGNNGTTAHDNMPPYLVVFMWKRTG